MIKHSHDRIYIKVSKTEYMAKHRYLYETYHNVKLLDSDIVIFLDGNHSHFKKDNLYRITKTINGLMVGQQLYGIKSTDRLTLINYCEWKHLLKEERK